MTETQITLNTDTRKSRTIKPIPYLERVNWTSKFQMKYLKKKGYKIKSLNVSSTDILWYTNRTLAKIFIRANNSYLKQQKMLIHLYTSTDWLTIYEFFYPLKGVLKQLKSFTIGLDPYSIWKKKFNNMLMKTKRLSYFEDLLSNKRQKASSGMEIWPLKRVQSFKFSQSVDLKVFSDIRHLSIKVDSLNKDLTLPPKLKEISIIDRNPPSKNDGNITKFNSLIKSISILKELVKVDLVLPFTDYYKHFFEAPIVKELIVNLHVSVSSIIDSEETQMLIKKFIQNTGSRVVINPKNVGTDRLFELFSFIEENYNDYNGLFYVEALSFNFHSKKENQDKMIEFYTKTYKNVNELSFKFSTNSMDCFTPWRRENWKKIFMLAYEKAREINGLKIRFDVEFVDGIHAETLDKIVTIFISLIEQESIETEIIEKKGLLIELNINASDSKKEKGLTEFLDRVLKVSRKINVLICRINYRYLLGSYQSIAEVLRESKDSNVLKHFVLMDK